MNIDANIRAYFDGLNGSKGRKPDERYSSFDYCFNYFQSFRESGHLAELINSDNMQMSCLQLGFYLASWGMLRGSAELLQKSARYLVPVIKVIASSDILNWEIDAHCYTDSNVERLCELAKAIRQAHTGMSDILLTKIMLGVFGSVPAFDTNFKQGCKSEGIIPTFGRKALKQIGDFYHNNIAVIETYRLPTLDFITGEETQRRYTRARVIDMAFFIESGETGRVAPIL